ncbi:MAG: hypothetical protein LQ347_001566 [Umbilicaria vellea]|nr:MAG: hypothetical protein LQ347_001566 [Umbilicaria vellea]
MMEPLEVTQSVQEPWNSQVTPAKRKLTEELPDERPPRELDNRYTVHDPTIHGYDDSSTYHNQKQQSTLADGSIMNGAMDRPHVNEQQVDLHGLPPGERYTQTNATSPVVTPGADSVHATRETSRPGSRGQPSSASSSVTPSLQQPLTPRLQSNHQTRTSQPSPTPPASHNTASAFAPPAPPRMTMHVNLRSNVKQEAGSSTAAANSPEQPSRKRPRHDEPPIFARKASRGNPLLPNKRPSAPKSATAVKQELLLKQEPMEAKPPAALISSLTAVKDVTNGNNGNAVQGHDMPLPKGQPELGDHGPLGPWESSILGSVIPYEDLTRTISDWLFQQVVTRGDVDTGPAGGGPGLGAILEIEAKIGQIIDLNRGERLRLPVLTECVISQSDPSIRTKFESSMTESQHRTLNGFLNKALLSSQPTKTTPTSAVPPKPRIPMSYVHTRECDASYELKSSSYHTLPPSVRALINQRHRPRVRITTDQKSGRELAKIIKMRVADIEIYSPRTLFDWRVSVSLEMNYDGDMRDLEETTEGGKKADRNKDRMSYKHLAYQIDLTQVTPAEATSKADKVHELEIEVSSAEVRRQGLLAQKGEISQYEELIKGFVDNVRVLARHCQ